MMTEDVTCYVCAQTLSVFMDRHNFRDEHIDRHNVCPQRYRETLQTTIEPIHWHEWEANQ